MIDKKTAHDNLELAIDQMEAGASGLILFAVASNEDIENKMSKVDYNDHIILGGIANNVSESIGEMAKQLSIDKRKFLFGVLYHAPISYQRILAEEKWKQLTVEGFKKAKKTAKKYDKETGKYLNKKEEI